MCSYGREKGDAREQIFGVGTEGDHAVTGRETGCVVAVVTERGGGGLGEGESERGRPT